LVGKSCHGSRQESYSNRLGIKAALSVLGRTGFRLQKCRPNSSRVDIHVGIRKGGPPRPA
jgi:hypothetical protein